MYKYGFTQSRKMPGPELRVEVSSELQPNVRESVTCLIDTAAVATVLPVNLVKRLSLRDYTSATVTWGSGETTEELKYRVNLHVAGRLFPSLWVFMCRKDYGLIGRDMLNAHLLTCDGPAEAWKVEPAWL